ncbi:YceI family protein [Exiguobacterium algae]|uniref:YceI family protein n=1 Tax=Exiguobacterium algae TaxID=2751250 RepID=UPI001BEA0B85|nr:YceI family protein [Exiguobacterium algae]
MAGTYHVDLTRSKISFSVRHMRVSKVRGEFKQFKIEAKGDPHNLNDAHVNVLIQVASIETHGKERDRHLRSSDFFYVDKYPYISFESKAFHSKGHGKYQLVGNLTIRGETREERVDVTILRVKKGTGGQQLVLCVGSGVINREAYGLTWNQALEAGGVLVGQKVTYEFELHFSGMGS